MTNRPHKRWLSQNYTYWMARLNNYITCCPRWQPMRQLFNVLELQTTQGKRKTYWKSGDAQILSILWVSEHIQFYSTWVGGRYASTSKATEGLCTRAHVLVKSRKVSDKNISFDTTLGTEMGSEKYKLKRSYRLTL